MGFCPIRALSFVEFECSFVSLMFSVTGGSRELDPAFLKKKHPKVQESWCRTRQSTQVCCLSENIKSPISVPLRCATIRSMKNSNRIPREIWNHRSRYPPWVGSGHRNLARPRPLVSHQAVQPTATNGSTKGAGWLYCSHGSCTAITN